jgi:hypothetical protein
MLSDLLYSYETYKCVRIKDRTLGLLYWGLFILIVIYIFGFVIVIDKGYLAYDTPVGIVRAKLVKPRGLEIRTDEGSHPYCAQGACRIWDHYDIVYPKSESDTLSISTQVTEIDQVRVCQETDPICSTDVFTETGKNNFFIANVEDFEVVVEHSMQAEKLIYEEDEEESGFAESSRHMNGRLMAKNDTALVHFPRNKADRFPVKVLLEAAEVDLDQKSDALKKKKKNELHETMRARGLVLFVVITYSNTNTFFGTHPVRYEYRVHRLHETDFVVYETLGTSESADNTRHLHKRHGIHLKFIITGSIGRFSLQALLGNIVSALGLVTLSSIVVDQLAIYVLPRKRQYANYKYTDATVKEEKKPQQPNKKNNKDKAT